MNHESLDFAHIPSFPDDVATVPLLRISLERLIRRDVDELQRLWEACQKIGFFYLDLRRAEASKRDSGHEQTVHEGVIDGEGLLSNASGLFDLGEQFFGLTIEEKLEYDFRDQGSYFGYKGYGAAVVDKEGTRDRNEFYNTSKDFVLNLRPSLPEPGLLKNAKSRSLMKDFMLQSHAIVSLLLDILNDHLELPSGRLCSLHRLREVSGDQVRWVRAPPQPEDDRKKALGEHTGLYFLAVLGYVDSTRFWKHNIAVQSSRRLTGPATRARGVGICTAAQRSLCCQPWRCTCQVLSRYSAK